MSNIAKPNNFSANTPISSSQVNANFDTIYNDYNGNVSEANLADDAVTADKIADDAVTTAKLADSAVITANLADDAVTPPKIGQAYSVRVTKSANGSFASNAVITWDTETWKTSSGMHDNSTNSGRLVAPIDGYYQLNCSVSFLNGETGSERIVRTRVNGSTTLHNFWVNYNSSLFNYVAGSCVVRLAAGEYVELLNVSGVTVTVRGGALTSSADLTFIAGL